MRRRFGVLLLTAGAAVLVGCERDELLSVDPGRGPGQSAATVEVLVDAGQLEGWVDTIFSGFSRPSSATFMRVEDGTNDLQSRGLIRFSFIEDTVSAAGELSGALRFDSAQVILRVDTLRTELPEAGSTLQLRAVEQGWDSRSATWDYAVDTLGVREPWSTPGGALGAVLSEALLAEATDSLVFELGELSDSLIQLWNDTTQVNTGVAVVVADSGRLALQSPQLRYQLVPEATPDTSYTLSVFGTAGTFIFDPKPAALASGVLRVGGVQGWRTFLEILLPDSLTVEGFPEKLALRGATVNRAEIVFSSLGPPDPPFAAEDAFNIFAYDVVDDFRVYGPKTPVGALVVESGATVSPDILEAGVTVSIGITTRLQRWAESSPGSSALLRIVMRAQPEAGTFGFWEFGTADADSAFVPRLRIVFTPPTEFAFP